MDYFGLITSLVSGLLPTAAIYYFSQKKEDKKEADERHKIEEAERAVIRESHQAMLRSHILWAIDKDKKRGFRTDSSTQNVDLLYVAYHKLNGNGVVTEAYEKFKNIPIKYN